MLHDMLESLIESAWKCEFKEGYEIRVTYTLSDWMLGYIGFTDFLE